MPEAHGSCPDCAALGFQVKVERYRDQALGHCTLHHWSKNARRRGWDLERYVRSSELFNFKCSLPNEAQTAVILGSLDR